jgi:asparagine synthetase B (glutamine-hydrolysing)
MFYRHGLRLILNIGRAHKLTKYLLFLVNLLVYCNSDLSWGEDLQITVTELINKKTKSIYNTGNYISRSKLPVPVSDYAYMKAKKTEKISVV